MRLYNLLYSSLHSIYKNRFSIKQKKFKQIWPEFQSLNVYPSKTSLFKHLGRWVCMKWYPLAHLAAVTMSCFCAERQAVQLLFPNSAGGIARALPSFLLYMFKFPDSRCRLLMSLSDNLNPFQRCQGGKHKLCTYGEGMAKSRWAGTPSYAKTTDLSGSIFPCLLYTSPSPRD